MFRDIIRPSARTTAHGAIAATLTALLVAACALLAACTSPTVPAGDGPTDSTGDGPADAAGTKPASSAPARPFDPTTLVGHWTVTDAAGEWSGTVAQFDSEVTLWRRCGDVHLPYIVGPDSSLRVGTPNQWSGGCSGTPSAGWLTDAAIVAHRGSDVVLLSAEGVPTATLRPGGTPHVDKDTSPDLAAEPTLTPELEEWLEWSPPTLPARLEPATPTLLVGPTWYPVQPATENPDGAWVRFDADGTWSGRDGCNGSGGLYVLADGGALRTTSGAMTLIGCAGVPVQEWVQRARTAATDDGGTTLVLLDADGTELGRLTARAD